MFLSNLGLTLNLEVQYPTVELIYVFAFAESMSYLFWVFLPIGRCNLLCLCV